MRVLLVSPNRQEINMRTWPLGLACVAAAALRAGHQTTVLDLMGLKSPRGMLEVAIVDSGPQAIGLSVRNIDDQSMENCAFLLDEVKEVVGWCRELSSAPVILGGAGFSIFPEPVLAYVGADMGIQGEGEASFLALLDRLEKGTGLSGVPSLYVAGRGIQGERRFAASLDEFPLPSPSTLFPTALGAEDFWLPVQTRRGCPMNCSYCSTAAIEGCRIRKRSPERVIEWMRQWVDAGTLRFYFVDNTFNLPPSYAKEICSRLIETSWDIRWRAIIHPGRTDRELVRLMARAGCAEVALGFESGSQRILKMLHKCFTLDQVRKQSRVFAESGIRRMGFLLLGGPGETKESVEESLSFADSLRLDAVKISIGIRIYPQTTLANIAVEEGVISPEDDLLAPTFYIVPELEEWLHEVVAEWMSTRPNWLR